ncbi:MAG: GNAT family N-acetyltransferase [Alphaproteobacteria bacterium]|nr:GNAT family N-acetyltransferase [Alphaproteobacteria bacterium]MDE1985255.1 GNAT family N-acetyltransferase [Alphaproteobacteria bacterium]MDE2162594.1 GNAT family N-acetyltransferase [Alphaproteobacteria bacterium]MDE2266879.1 GNAT family N-acetyltransferase [Alphaproteobacteria bacterium]MDE2500497.1 GNAT family N-acetyltransferase [Alphaproteobacteria bacterium]
MTAIIVERLGAVDVDALRAIRLESLNLHPDCFSADPDIVGAMTTEQWLDGLSRGIWFGVRKDGALVAIAALTRPESKKINHTGELCAMYVRADARGTGIADSLIRYIVDVAAEEIDQITVTVNAENKRAIKLYERHGFRIAGRIPRYIRVGNSLHDELIMVRAVSSSD